MTTFPRPDATAALPDDEAFPTAFAAQVSRTPSAIAVSHRESTWSYREFSDLADRIVRRLLAAGVKAGDPVALCLERVPAAIAGVLAILRLGAVYVPIDPSDPPARLAFVLVDSGATAVLTNAALRATLPVGAARVVLVDGVASDVDGAATADTDAPSTLSRHVSGSDAAYIMYTSGSTGPPKGVLVTHRSLVNHLRWVHRDVVGDVVLPAVSLLTFDASLKQILGPLLYGGEVWLLPEESTADPRRLVEALCARAATGTRIGFNGVPSLWRGILDVAEGMHTERLRPLRDGLGLVLIGGETLGADLVERTTALLSRCAVWNLYGPTEATVNATAGRVEPAGEPTIGTPVDNAQIFLLDRHLRPVPPGAPGSLFIGGVGLAVGYVGRPVETAAHFRPHPFSAVPGERLYDSGDLARCRADGQFEFLGRRDRQVKVRGFRIELDGIEAALRRLPGVCDAAALVHVTPAGEASVAGFVVAKQWRALSLHALRTQLAQTLPKWSVPTILQQVRALPLTAAGKVDRVALAALLGKVAHSVEPGRADKATVAHVEHELATIWAGLLGRSSIDTHDDFFALGGTSELATELIARVRESFDVELPPATVSAARTLGGLAALIQWAWVRG